MNKKKVFLTLQSVLCVVFTVMLAAVAIEMYREGLALKATDPLSWIFTRKKAAEAFILIFPVLILGLVLTGLGLFKGIRDENGDRPVKDTRYLRNLTVARVAVPSAGMERERILQKKLFYGGWILFALCMVPVFIYIINGDHFPNGNLEPVFLSLIGHVLPWTALSITVLMISAVLQEKSMQREIEVAKEQLRLEKDEGGSLEINKKEKKTHGGIQVLRVALLVLAFMLIVAGTFNGSARDVFGKAVNICTECVGLG